MFVHSFRVSGGCIPPAFYAPPSLPKGEEKLKGMFVLGAEITIGGIRFKRVNSVEIESDMRRLEDVATIKIPTTALLTKTGDFATEVETAKTFAVGDEVIIKKGYDGDLREEFHGYVSKIRPNTPLEIECVDATWLLRRINLQKGFQNVTLRELLDFILSGTGITLEGEPPTINFKQFYFRNVSAAKALQKLKDEYGLVMYFKSFKKLFVGISSDNDGATVKYRFGQNVIDQNLEWESEEDVKMSVKAINIRKDNTKVEKEVGDAEGEKRTIFLYDLQNESDLERLALEELKKYRFTGYKGSFKTFLLPVCRVGNVADIVDPNFPERGGKYLIEKITVSYGEGGGRRKVTPGLKVSS